MNRAGAAACELAAHRWPHARRWLILCGAGNNAGDGYVIARLARAAGIDVRVLAMPDPAHLSGDAATAWADYSKCGGVVEACEPGAITDADLIVDALLGTGLARDLDPAWKAVVESANAAGAPVLAVDVPSGLDAGTGAIRGACVHADATVTFVGLKSGLFLGRGPEVCGEIRLDTLGVPPELYAQVPPDMRVAGELELRATLPPRRATDHKGRFGHVLVVGGNHGMPGAVRLAGEAALRAGAGLVSIATRPDTANAIAAGRPELMCRAVHGADDLRPLLERATVVAVGPGLGTDEWARDLLSAVLQAARPKVVDADALNLLAGSGRGNGPQPAGRREDWVLTPHPGEAARLLGRSTAEVQADRAAALQALSGRYGGVVLLKGRCTLVGRSGELPYVVDRGNPGMATAGTGDVLTGLVAGLLAQAPEADMARTAAAAAFLHAAAGDAAAGEAPRGLIASDLFAHLRPWLNP